MLCIFWIQRHVSSFSVLSGRAAYRFWFFHNVIGKVRKVQNALKWIMMFQNWSLMLGNISWATLDHFKLAPLHVPDYFVSSNFHVSALCSLLSALCFLFSAFCSLLPAFISLHLQNIPNVCVVHGKSSTGPPGGNQADGLPPASSTDADAASWLQKYFRHIWLLHSGNQKY